MYILVSTIELDGEQVPHRVFGPFDEREEANRAAFARRWWKSETVYVRPISGAD